MSSRPNGRRYTDPVLDLGDERQRLAEDLEFVRGASSDRTRQYIAGVVMTCILAVMSVVGITIIRPTQDNTALIATLLGVLGPVIVGLMAAIAQQIQKSVNGRMTELLLAHRAAARLQGRQDPRTPRPGQQTVYAPSSLPEDDAAQ